MLILYKNARNVRFVLFMKTSSVGEIICDGGPSLDLETFVFKNSLSAPTQVFEECSVQSTPPPEMKIVREVGTLDLS